MGKQRPTPSLPKLRCLDAPIDAADAAAGELLAAVSVELHDKIVARSQRQKAEWRRARADKRKPANGRAALPKEPPAEWPHESPVVVAPRIRATSSPHRRIPRSARLVPMTLDDPDYAGAPAQMVKPPAGARANGHGLSKEWQAPPRPQVHVVATTRGDVLNYMHARRQIDRASFMAGRRYQSICDDAAAATRIRSIDVGMPPISSGVNTAGDFALAGVHLQAARRLDQVHRQLHADIGAMGVDLVVDILARGMTVESAAEVRGDGDDKQAVRFWGSLFRRCLRHLAAVLGFATSTAPRP